MKYFLISLITLFVIGQANATHGTRLIGFGAQSIGRAGASIGTFDNPSVMMTNPAGLSFLPGSSLDADFSLMVPTLHFTNALNDEAGKTNYFPMPALDYASHTGDAPLSWGVGLFTMGGMGADFTLHHALYGSQPMEYHSQLAVMMGGPAVSYKVSPHVAVGASAHIVYSMLEFRMPYSLSPSVMKGIIDPSNGMTFGDLFAAPPSRGGFGYSEVTAAAAMNGLKGFGFSAKLGVAFQVGENMTLGVSYTSPTPLSYKNGAAGMDMTAQLNDAFGKAVQGYMAQHPDASQQDAQGAVMNQFSGMGIDLSKGAVAGYSLGASLTLPQSIGVGAMLKPSESVRLSADIEWVNWRNAWDKMTIDLSDGNNPNINRMLGNAGALSLDFPMNWNNQLCFSLGGEYDVNSALTLRGGYSFGNNPVPAETVFPVFPAIVENHITVGGSLHLSEPLTLHAAYELVLSKEQTASTQSIVASEYNNSTSHLGENIFHISLSYGL